MMFLIMILKCPNSMLRSAFPNYILQVVSRFKYSLVKFAHAFPFGPDHDNYPTLRLFIDGNVNNSIAYTDPESTPENKLNANRIKRFLRKHTNLVITLDNCTKELDELAQRFVESSAQDVKED